MVAALSPRKRELTLVEKLIDYVLDDFDAGKALAEEYNLWPELQELLVSPLRRQLCYHDCNAFIEYLIIDPETGLLVEQQPFHEEWQYLITNHKRVLIVAPRGHGKTMQVAARIVWEIGRNPNIRIKIIGATEEKAKEIAGIVKRLITKEPKVREIFPDLEIDDEAGDTKGAFFVVRDNYTIRDATVQAAGVLSAGAGGRADLLVCDDVVDMKNSVINPATREQVIRTVKETWFSLVAATGRIVWIATPYHVADATHNLRDHSGNTWTVWWTPAEKKIPLYDEDNQPLMEYVYQEDGKTPLVDEEGRIVLRQKFHLEILWPDKWSKEKLDAKGIELDGMLNGRIYSRQYLLNAMSDDEKTFPDSVLSKSYDYDLHDIGVGIEDEWPTFGGVDLASALGEKNAYTVIMTLARNPNNNRLMIKSMFRKRMGFPETMDMIDSEFKRQKWRFAYAENNGYQKAVLQAAELGYKYIPVEGFHTSASGKANELIGLPGLAVAFAKGLFQIPAAKFPLAPDDQSDLAVLMMELQSYPGGEFSDTVMALWFAYRAAIEGQSDFGSLYLECVELM